MIIDSRVNIQSWPDENDIQFFYVKDSFVRSKHMKCLTILFLLSSLNLYAQDKEADLQMPVTDVSQIERQEEELPPTLEEVEMKQKKTTPDKKTDYPGGQSSGLSKSPRKSETK